MDTVKVCETCGSENVHTAGDGGMGFCEDCDAPCTTVDLCEHCNNTGIFTHGWMKGFFCSCNIGKKMEEQDDPRADLYAIQ
jgi:hypothetical protein